MRRGQACPDEAEGMPSGQPARCRRYKLPAAAGATVASSASPEQEEVEQEFAQRGQQHDQENYAKNEQLFSGQLSPWLDSGLCRELRTGPRQLYARIERY